MFSSNTSAVSGDVNYIEDVFSSYLRTGTNTTANVVNGIDFAGKGGMVWFKARNQTGNHIVYDTARGAAKYLYTNSTNAQNTNLSGYDLTAFNADGYTLGTPENSGVNDSPFTNVAWSFRKQPKFFDVVTYTGNGTAGRTVAHSLGSVPGCVIVKRTSGTASAETGWATLHKDAGRLYLDLTSAAGGTATTATLFGDGTNVIRPTSTEFTVGAANQVNTSGETYVAYIFAHNAGGFGLTGTDNVISCGSFTTDGSGRATVELGYEPQWLMQKSTGTGRWEIEDVMRGWSRTSVAQLMPNLSNAEEVTDGAYFTPTATGFTTISAGLLLPSVTYIYIAIRRGPMKVPTDGTKVFKPVAYTGNGAASRSFTDPNFAPDLIWTKSRSNGTDNKFMDRLRGTGKGLNTNDTGSEGSAAGYYVTEYGSLGWTLGTADASYNNSGYTYGAGAFRRAPSFFDEVCYTGTGTSGQTYSHNLGVTPELIIFKRRESTSSWWVWSSTSALTTSYYLNLNSVSAKDAFSLLTGVTSTTFSCQADTSTNANAGTYAAYLFATCPGVSKVGSYTGTGTTKQVDCGFAAGARFVLIKRTDSSGDWYVWDTARGIVNGNDPYLLMNTADAEVTSTDYIDTYSAGFELSSTAPAALNASGGTYIFLAIA